MRKLFRKARVLFQSRTVFPTWRDRLAYIGLLEKPRLPKPREVRVHVTALGGEAVTCREGTTDANVLWATFFNNYHLPAVRLEADCRILDLGANVGYTVAHYACLYPRSRVVGVEMDHANFELAVRNVAPWGERCQMLCAAVSVSDGEITYTGDREDGFHMTDSDTPQTANLKRAPSLSVSSLLDRVGWRQVDFVKMDIEGAELDVLQGPVGWLATVRQLKIEIHRERDFKLIEQILRAHGFDCSKDTVHWSSLIAIKRT